MKKTSTKKTTSLVEKKETGVKPMWTNEQIKLITRTVAKGATMDELSLFLYTANKVKLDPLAKQIYFVKRGGQMSIQTGIDGYLAIAERTKQLAGIDDVIYDDGQNGKEPNNPSKATVTVYRLVGGKRVPFIASARWKEYFPGEKMAFMWKKMPYQMLGKCALSLALRKAFPNDLSGINTTEEMQQFDTMEIIENKPINASVTNKVSKTIVDTEKPKKQENSTENQEKQVFYCEACDIEISKNEHDYSKNLVGKALCAEDLKLEQ